MTHQEYKILEWRIYLSTTKAYALDSPSLGEHTKTIRNLRAPPPSHSLRSLIVDMGVPVSTMVIDNLTSQLPKLPGNSTKIFHQPETKSVYHIHVKCEFKQPWRSLQAERDPDTPVLSDLRAAWDRLQRSKQQPWNNKLSNTKMGAKWQLIFM